MSNRDKLEEICREADCNGVRLTKIDRCLAHAAEEDVVAALNRLGDGEVLDARGVVITSKLLDRIVAAAPLDEHNSHVLNAPRFARANFHGEASFKGLSFQGLADFDKAAFHNGASFQGAVFSGTASFQEAKFSAAIFDQATFLDDAQLNAEIRGRASFVAATFSKTANFRSASFGEAHFSTATFKGPVDFSNAELGPSYFAGAKFQSDTYFGETRFKRWVTFDDTSFQKEAFFVLTCEGSISFERTTFDIAHRKVLILATDQVRFDDISFADAIDSDVRASELVLNRIRFLGGGHLRVAEAKINLTNSEVPSPLIISSEPVPSSGVPSDRHGAALPAVTSLEGTNVAGLVLTGVSLQDCRFADTHNLDKLRIEGPNTFSRMPYTFGRGRQVLVEEAEWRASRWLGLRWRPMARRVDRRITPRPLPRDPERIASLYRSLRKGREDNKDEPGAADFYYGEMEMRRKARSSPPAEKLILAVYWLISGYSLRAWRAFSVLIILTAIFAGLFQLYGFKYPDEPFYREAITTSSATTASASPQPTMASKRPVRWPPSIQEAWEATIKPEAWTYSVGTATAIFVALPDAELTAAGRRFRIVLRLIGPLLLGLGILSLRGRVKR
jgi:uncharacterized protein YjbI with pentapeptide repeats